jgi:hypothetical protein
MRRDWTIAQRVAELARWDARTAEADFMAWLQERIIAALCAGYGDHVFQGDALYREYLAERTRHASDAGA